MLINSLTLLAALMGLLFSANRCVAGAASLARLMRLSPLLIGLLIVGLGTSLPEITIAIFAAQAGNVGLGIGNIIGSNIANIGLVLGGTALLMPLTFQSNVLKRELPILLVLTLLCYCISFDGLGRGDSVLILLIFSVFLAWLIRTAKKEEFDGDFEKELKAALPNTLSLKYAWLAFGLGLAGLLLATKLLVWSAMNVIHLAGLNEFMFGVTVLALASSLPELVFAIASILKREDDLAMGNILGSSLYNLLGGYAAAGLIAPGEVSAELLNRDFPVALGFVVVLYFLGRGYTSKQGNINRWEGAILILAYSSYLWLIYEKLVDL